MLQNSDSEHTSAATKFEKLTGSYTKSVRDLFPSDPFFGTTPTSTTRSRTARKRSAHKINTHVRTLKTVLDGAVEQPSAASTAVDLRNEHTQLKATGDVVATFDMSLLEALLNGPVRVADASCKDPSEEMSSQQSSAAEEDGQKISGAEQTNDEAKPDADDTSEDVSEAEEEAEEEENATEEEEETDEEEEEAEEASEKNDEGNEAPKSHLQKDQQNTQETDANEQRDKVEHGGAIVRQGVEEQDDDAEMTLFDSSNDDTHMVGTQPHCSG
jgi:TATA-binding protein-associated factor Taf7